MGAICFRMCLDIIPNSAIVHPFGYKSKKGAFAQDKPEKRKDIGMFKRRPYSKFSGDVLSIALSLGFGDVIVYVPLQAAPL
jgi:hypothetical protein